jgi:hypothetical protein
LGVDAGEADGDEDGHGEQEGDAARREEGGDLKEGEGDKEEEDHDEEDKDTAEEDDDKARVGVGRRLNIRAPGLLIPYKVMKS